LGLKPGVSLTIDGEEKKGVYRERLKRLVLKDERGLLADQLELSFDDSDGRLAVPERGHLLSVALGWGESLTPMGSFFVDEVSVSSRGVMRLTGKGFDTLKDLKTVSSRLYTAGDLKGVLDELGRIYGLKVKAAAALSRVRVTEVSQRNESAVHFLSRLADEHALLLKLQGVTVLVLPQGAGESVSGESLPVVDVAALGGKVLSWDFDFVSRPLYASVEAEAFDLHTAQSEKVVIGSGKPVFRFREVFSSREKAEQAAAAKLALAERQGVTGRLELEGEARICADSRLRLSGFRAAVDGLWSVTSATHTVAPEEAYVVSLACERLPDQQR
jgi:phage protein D